MELRACPFLLWGLWMAASQPLEVQRWRLQAEQKTVEGAVSQTLQGGAEDGGGVGADDSGHRR